MTTGPGPQPTQPPDGPTFAGLVEELRELGFEPREHSQPGHAAYAATDSPALVTVTDEPGRRTVRITVRPADATSWGLDWTAGTPHAVQLIALYAALNADPAAAIAAAAAAICPRPPDNPAEPSTPAS